MADDVQGVLQRGLSVVRERVRFDGKRNGRAVEGWFTYSVSPIPDGHGGVGGVFHVYRDETANVLDERNLARWKAAIGGMSVGVVLADADGNLIEWNRAAPRSTCTATPGPNMPVAR